MRYRTCVACDHPPRAERRAGLHRTRVVHEDRVPARLEHAPGLGEQRERVGVRVERVHVDHLVEGRLGRLGRARHATRNVSAAPSGARDCQRADGRQPCSASGSGLSGPAGKRSARHVAGIAHDGRGGPVAQLVRAADS